MHFSSATALFLSTFLTFSQCLAAWSVTSTSYRPSINSIPKTSKASFVRVLSITFAMTSRTQPKLVAPRCVLSSVGCQTRQNTRLSQMKMGVFDFLQPKSWSEEQKEQLDQGSIDDQEGIPLGIPSLLKGTYMQGRQLSLAYKATQNGWNAIDFHKACDSKGPCIVVGTTEGGYSFGAFNPIGWQSDDDYKASTQAFLFFYPVQGGAPVKLEKLGGGEAALFDYARSGPHFGADGLVIGASQQSVMGLFAGPDPTDVTIGQGQLQSAYSNLGQSYARIPSEYGQTSIFGFDTRSARLVELEVYYSQELANMF